MLESRRSFVTQVVNRYAEDTGNAKAPGLENLTSFILGDVLEPDELWAKHEENVEWLNLPAVALILTQCLKQLHPTWLEDMPGKKLRLLALPEFTKIIQVRWNCPVPFILC
jgi:hypothetical protein